MSTKISQLTSAVDVTANDLIQIVDVEDGVMAPSGTNKKTTASLLANQLVPLINAGAIAGSKIADSGITSAKIANDAITNAKIANDAITSTKIANDTIVNADINSSAAIAGTKISPNFGSQNIITTGTLSAGNVFSGTYTPTLTNVTNLNSTEAFVCQYMRVGDVVTVSGLLNANPITTGDTKFEMSLPITSDFSSQSNLGGVAQSTNSYDDNPVSISGDILNNQAVFRWSANRTFITGYSFTFTYRVI